MSARPSYFESVRAKAAEDWDLFDARPDLAGPWHQLFRQVLSPGHVLSELLQNADDAGATEATVSIQHDVFVFEHNGQDFNRDDFESLCSFGYSRKRTLHTIGFRGIGFKSTFSLGDRVDLYTPSLSVYFRRDRFTEPHWQTPHLDTEGRTRVQVAIGDRQRATKITNNLEEWLRSPVSLLFLRSLRQLRIGDRETHWHSLGPGPIPASEWMALNGDADEPVLVIHSKAAMFPADALAEIHDERGLTPGEEFELPPCEVEIAFGVSGRIYVVLPTGVKTDLPFAVNAPFIQDPARTKIKDPATSATNRWLLERAGQLAANSMLAWLSESKASLAERASAYALLPDVDREDESLEGVCGTHVEEAFSDTIGETELLLAEDGQLLPNSQCIIIPSPIRDTWPLEQAAALLDADGRPPLCRHVSESDREKLLHWGFLDQVDRDQLLDGLQSRHLPKPETWRQLLILWAYIAPVITRRWSRFPAETLNIVPVQGREVLQAPANVARLGDKKLLQSEGDWDFLARYLLVMNQNWPRFLAEQRRLTADSADSSATDQVEAALAVLEHIGLNTASDASTVIDRAAARFSRADGNSMSDYVRLAQIAAKLAAKAGSSFPFLTRTGDTATAEEDLLYDEDGQLEDLLPVPMRDSRLVHSDYYGPYTSCSREDWLQWISSGSARLHTFVPLYRRSIEIRGKERVEAVARERGVHGSMSYRYVTHDFVLEDWDFDETCWSYWKEYSTENGAIWATIGRRVLAQRESYWKGPSRARLLQVATTGTKSEITGEAVLPNWILRLRQLPCLQDTHGHAQRPDDLLRRTPETEPLLDVAPFVHGSLDRNEARSLLGLLGVSGTPPGPDTLLDRLRALTSAEKAPVSEVHKWYRRLDQMLTSCSTDDAQKIKVAFRSERLILANDGTWTALAEVSLSAGDEDVPDAPMIPPAIGDLTLWKKIGVPDRPTVDRAIEWLVSLESGMALSPQQANRVRALLARHSKRIWHECGHWLNLAGEWTPVARLSFALTMHSLTPWSHLHPQVKQSTADFQRLPREVTAAPPFSSLPPLSTRIEERLQEPLLNPARAVRKEWLCTLGSQLARVELESKEETARARALAMSLAHTDWIEARQLEIVPYIDGTPAGTPRRSDVIWLDQALYVGPLPKAKLARLVPEEIGRVFARPDIKAALDYSFERSPREVQDYIEENFKLAPAVHPPSQIRAAESVNSEHSESAPATGDGGVELEPQSLAEREPHPIPVDENTATADTAEDDVAESGEGGDAGEGGDRDAPVDRGTQRSRQSSRPPITERFARSHGFERSSDDRFGREDGSSITRDRHASFPWQLYNARGELECSYLLKDHCLERGPLEIEADVWSLIQTDPEHHALVLVDRDGRPVELAGRDLLAMRDDAKIKLYPATYRLVYIERAENLEREDRVSIHLTSGSVHS